MAGGWRRDFNFVWTGETASLVGTQVYQLAMPLTAVLTFDASPAPAPRSWEYWAR